MQVIVIVGPTGVGKTKLSVELAKRVNGEIINGDSTQVYKGLDIATAKVTEEEKEQIPHHLFDIKEVSEDYTVFDYQKDCRNKIEEILKRGKTPILVGGTGLYLKAALYDYEFLKETKKKDYSKYSNEELYKLVLKKDPNNQIHPNNRKRLERALSYMEEVGKPFSEKEKTEKPLYDVVWIGLTMDRKTLYERINQRVDVMVKQGLLEEAKKYYDSKIRTKAILTPIGYKELFPYFDGSISLEEALNTIKQKSRNYAKRQYTWFTHQVPVHWITALKENFDKTVEEAMKLL